VTTDQKAGVEDEDDRTTSKGAVLWANSEVIVVERREPTDERQPRLDVSLTVSFDSGSNFYVGFTENLSDGGVFVATHVPRPIGSTVGLLIAMPNGTPIRARGTVAWIREYSEANDAVPGMGIRFDEVSREDVDRILEFARSRQPIFFDGEMVVAERVPSP
jgi:uncharacterized protein (TIGR02266 family)